MNCADSWEAGEIGVDDLLRRLRRDADVLRQRERGLSVQQRVVDHLGRAALHVLVHGAVRAKHLQRRLIVDVVAAAERLDERFVLGQVGEHPQFDLRIVGRDQHVARLGDERAADLAAELGLDRNVLKIRIAAAQAPGRRHRLVEARVHAAGFRVHELRQRVDVGAFQLHQPAPLENLPRQIVGERKLLEHFDGRGRRA